MQNPNNKPGDNPIIKINLISEEEKDVCPVSPLKPGLLELRKIPLNISTDDDSKADLMSPAIPPKIPSIENLPSPIKLQKLQSFDSLKLNSAQLLRNDKSSVTCEPVSPSMGNSRLFVNSLNLKKFDSKNQIASATTLDAYMEIPTEFLVTSTKKSMTFIAPNQESQAEPVDMKSIRRQQRKKIAQPDTRLQHSIVPIKVMENVQIIHKEKTPEIKQQLVTSMKSHFVFSYLDLEAMDDVVSKFSYCTLKAGETIFKQGSDASLFFILAKGSIKIFVNSNEKHTLQAGSCFGELALLYNAPRSATLIAHEDCELWSLDRNTFRSTVEATITRQAEENLTFISRVKMFKNMTPDQKEAIAHALITQKFGAGSFIVHEEDPADSYYIIKTGTVSVEKSGKEVRLLTDGDAFGESALLEYGAVRAMSIKAVKETVLLALGRDTLSNILGDRVQNIAFRNVQRWAVERDPVLRNLTKMQIEKVLDEMRIRKYHKGEMVLPNSEVYNKVIIVMEGNIIDSHDKIVCKKGEIYGVNFLLENKHSEKLSRDLLMSDNGILSEVDYVTVMNTIGGTLQEIIKKNETSHEKKLSENKVRQQIANIPIESLLFVKKLGQGQFGNVYLVEDRDKKLYALKAISRMKVQQASLEKHLLAEKRVLEIMNFPFIVEYVRSYKDGQNIYFLLGFVKGMELFDVIRDIGLLTTYESQFYIGSLILAIEYLHIQHIVYRDIKPENIMVDEWGYIRMIDMGTCKLLKPTSSGAVSRTFTIIGTPLYMAPEVIAGKGYIFYADFWSIGICLYEFMCGMVPFGETLEDPYEIYEEILNKKLVFPNYLTDLKARILLDQLLSRIPEKRWGGSFAALKSHPWFDTFDFDKLLDKQLKPPYVPQSASYISEDDIKDARKINHFAISEIHAATPKFLKKQSGFDWQTTMGKEWDEEF
jgi:cGMP-dependent protein kinase